jgi:hypothetical protein
MRLSKRNILSILFLCLILGIFYGCFYFKVILILPQKTIQLPAIAKHPIKTYAVFYPQNQKISKDDYPIVGCSPIIIAQKIIKKWLQITKQEDLIDETVTIEAVLLDKKQQELFISFSKSIFIKIKPTYEKLLLIKSLFTTILQAITTVKEVRLLINHGPMNDQTLDFSIPWNVTLDIHQEPQLLPQEHIND